MPSVPRFTFRYIVENKVLVLLKTLDVKKATGTDGISGKLLRLVAPSVSSSLTSLYNCSIGNDQIPRE